jgi:3-isopropylmalate dehydrogenase
VKRYRIAVLPGDGIGPEVTAEAVKVLRAAADLFGIGIDTREYAVGAAGVAASGDALPPRTREGVTEADAVLLGAVGDPALAAAEGRRRPEAGLLALRKLLGVYANLRPVTVHPSLAHASPLRPERLVGVDLLIVRELTGGRGCGSRVSALGSESSRRWPVRACSAGCCSAWPRAIPRASSSQSPCSAARRCLRAMGPRGARRASIR